MSESYLADQATTTSPSPKSSSDLDTSSISQPYQYRPLEGQNEIRLLAFLPRDSNRPKDLHCTIIHAGFDNRPIYRALSYTWGSPDDPQFSVLVDGQIFMARENLWQALNILDESAWEDVDSEDSSAEEMLVNNEALGCFWIDAICIDQSNVKERNEQVRKMKDIYERAEEVIVWLGPSANNFPEFEIVRQLHKRRHEINRVINYMRKPQSLERLKALVRLLGRPYWDRMWIFRMCVSFSSG
jgi:hypothetical protein